MGALADHDKKMERKQKHKHDEGSSSSKPAEKPKTHSNEEG